MPSAKVRKCKRKRITAFFDVETWKKRSITEPWSTALSRDSIWGRSTARGAARQCPSSRVHPCRTHRPMMFDFVVWFTILIRRRPLSKFIISGIFRFKVNQNYLQLTSIQSRGGPLKWVLLYLIANMNILFFETSGTEVGKGRNKLIIRLTSSGEGLKVQHSLVTMAQTPLARWRVPERYTPRIELKPTHVTSKKYSAKDTHQVIHITYCGWRRD